MKISTYFSRAEMECPFTGECNMDEEFMKRLDKVREIFGSPIQITSGYRSKMYNRKINGYIYSNHLIGKAADIPMLNPHERWKLVAAAMSAGMTGIEICDKHVHLEYVEDKEPKLWTGISK